MQHVFLERLLSAPHSFRHCIEQKGQVPALRKNRPSSEGKQGGKQHGGRSQSGAASDSVSGRCHLRRHLSPDLKDLREGAVQLWGVSGGHSQHREEQLQRPGHLACETRRPLRQRVVVMVGGDRRQSQRGGGTYVKPGFYSV